MTIAKEAWDQSAMYRKVQSVNVLRRLAVVRHSIDEIPLDPRSAIALVVEMQRMEGAVSPAVAELLRAAVFDEIKYGHYSSNDRDIAMQILDPPDEEQVWERQLWLHTIREKWA